jgi:hypothetical protein
LLFTGEAAVPRTTIRILHTAASSLGLLLVAAFLTATVAAELSGDPALLARVKAGIVAALWVLVPAMAVAGATGQRLAGRSTAPIVSGKARRMRFVAANAVLVLVPCALVLDRLAGAGQVDGRFMLVQAVELVAGGANLTLLGLNMRDGLRMRARRLSVGMPADSRAAQRLG